MTDNVRGSRRVVILLAVLFGIVVAVVFVSMKNHIWSPIPDELVGKWEVVQGKGTGSLLEFHRNGDCIGEMNILGRRGTLNARVAVSGDKLHITTISPITRRPVVATQVLKKLTPEEVIIRESGADYVMQRPR